MRIGGGGRPPERNVYLNGNKLCWSKKVRHLGNIITHDLNDSEDINLKKGVFISQINKLNYKFKLYTVLSGVVYFRLTAVLGMYAKTGTSLVDPSRV